MPTPRSSPLTTGRLLRSRARARTGLLASASAAVAAAVATVCLVLAWLARAVSVAGDPPPPGVPADDVADQVEQGAAALASASPALVLLVVILAGTAIAQLARLVAVAREHETATIRARGFSRGQAWATDAAEAVAVTVAGGLLGVAVAVAGALVAGGSSEGVLAQWAWALATTLVLAVAFAVSLRRTAERTGSTRTTRATTAALVVIVLLAAGIVVWQLPLARGRGFDPIVAIAPAAVLLAGAVVALAAFAAGAVAWARPAAMRPGLSPGYPARQVSRRLPVYAVAVLLVGLTVAQAVFASAFTATWQAMTTDSAAVRAGADLRVDTSPQPVSPGQVAGAVVAGVDAASAALVTDIEIGSTDAQLVAVPSSRIDEVVTSAGGIIDRGALVAAAEPADGLVVSEPISLGPDANGLRVSVDLVANSYPRGFGLGAILVDAGGAPAGLSLAGELALDADGTVSFTGEAPLPEGVAPWTLLAIGTGLGPSVAAVDVAVTLTSVEALGAGPIDVAGSAQLVGSDLDELLWLGDGGVLASAGATAGSDSVEGLPPVAAVVSADLASRLGIGVGDPIEFRYAGTGRHGEARVTSIAGAVPGASTPLAVFVPLETLLTSQLQRSPTIVPPNSVWVSGDVGADAALSAAFDGRPVATSAPGVPAAVVGALVPGWWIAVAGSALLSLVAAFAIVQTLALARRRELGVLRALGVTASRQARLRAAELAGVFGAAVVLGGAAGALAAWLIAPSLVRAVTPGILPLAGGVSFAWPPLAIALAALVLGLAGIVAFAAAGVARAARTATVGEDAR